MIYRCLFLRMISLGDFNARVGRTNRGQNSVWHKARSYHGVREMSENCENLLLFYALNELIVKNTVYEKASVFKHTWNKTVSDTSTVLIPSLCI